MSLVKGHTHKHMHTHPCVQTHAQRMHTHACTLTHAHTNLQIKQSYRNHLSFHSTSRSCITLLSLECPSVPKAATVWPLTKTPKGQGWSSSFPFFSELSVFFIFCRSGSWSMEWESQEAFLHLCVIKKAYGPGKGNPQKCPPAPDPNTSYRQK